jgi:cyclase
MLRTRVIPCLLLQDGGLVKTSRFSAPKYVGDPINAIRIFNDKEVDELIVLDIGASRQGKAPDYDLIEQFAGECFMPLCYGGGIRTAEQAGQLFKLGVEKVALQSAAIDDPTLLESIAGAYGTQSLVASVDIKRNWRQRPLLYRAKTRKTEHGNWLEHLQDLVDAGAGEILLNAVDRDGIMRGMDIDLIREAASAISVPLIAVGGAGSLEDIGAAARAGASAVAAGAYFVFHGPHRAVLITYPRYQELEAILGESE